MKSFFGFRHEACSFSRAHNVPRTEFFIFLFAYRLGIISIYCHIDPALGLKRLLYASERGYVRATYAAGLILRDADLRQSRSCLESAARMGYIPARLELPLNSSRSKSRFGSSSVNDLGGMLDFDRLNRLLNRYYVSGRDPDDRGTPTSHCWNPRCGRWSPKRIRRSRGATDRRTSRERGGGGEDSTVRNGGALGRAPPPPGPGPAALWLHPDQLCAAPNPNNYVAEISTTAARMSVNTSIDVSGAAIVVPAPEGNANNAMGINSQQWVIQVSRMRMCSSCCRAKYCSKLCQIYDWRHGRHKTECQFL